MQAFLQIRDLKNANPPPNIANLVHTSPKSNTSLPTIHPQNATKGGKRGSKLIMINERLKGTCAQEGHNKSHYVKEQMPKGYRLAMGAHKATIPTKKIRQQPADQCSLPVLEPPPKSQMRKGKFKVWVSGI